MAKNNLLEPSRQRFWAKMARRYGVHLPPPLRDQLERESGRDECNPCDREEVGVFLSDLNGVAEDFLAKVRHLQDDQYLKRLLGSRTASKPASTGKKYQRCFEKRLHLVDFVVGRRLTEGNLVSRSLALHRRFKWRQICGQWNESHPYDQMTPDVLKATFYRAVRDHDLQEEFLARRERAYQARFREALSKIPSYDGRWDSWDFRQNAPFDDVTAGIAVSETWFPVPASPTSTWMVNVEGEIWGPITTEPRSVTHIVLDKEGKVIHEE